MLPPDTTAWVLGSGRAGHESHCFGVARELGLHAVARPIRPRRAFAALAPFGPVDPRDAPGRPGSPIAPPFPDIAFASGRQTVAYLRRLKRASGARTFTVFLEDPRVGARAADLIWVPEHDSLRGENVIATPTAPHPLRPLRFAVARSTPDPRVAALDPPRVALILGGPSAHYRFDGTDIAALAGVARDLAARGWSVMATPSRRTPPSAIVAIRDALATASRPGFIWDGSGGNPYVHMLANSDAIIVTGDSVNMVGEALASGVPVHVYELSGGHPKMTRFLNTLVARGLVRRWSGAIENWTYTPVDATAFIAGEVARRYTEFRAKR